MLALDQICSRQIVALSFGGPRRGVQLTRKAPTPRFHTDRRPVMAQASGNGAGARLNVLPPAAQDCDF